MSLGEEVVIVPYRDGPYLVRGAVSLRDQRGNEMVLTRTPIALCRCGRSRIRPFCDGTHRVTRFAAPSEMEAVATSGFQAGPAQSVAQHDDDDALRSAYVQAIRAELSRAAKLTEIALARVGSDAPSANGASGAAVTALREVARRLDALR
jgi:CDGSH-type Zn-finger protein